VDFSKLNDAQLKFALRVAEAAEKAGLNPDFALMLMYSESNFNPQEYEETDEDVNEGINVAIEQLRLAATKFKDPEKAAVAFFEGEESPYLKSGNIEDLNLDTQERLSSIVSTQDFPQNIFLGEPSAEAAPPAEDTEPVGPTDEEIAADRQAAQAVGAASGATLGAARAVRDVVRGGMPPPRSANIMGERPVAPRPGPVAQPQPIPGMRPDLSMPGDPQVERILQGTTEEGTTGRARQTGYNVETAQQAARNKQSQQILGALQQQGVLDPQKNFFASQSGLTSTPSGVLYPRAEPPRTLGPRGPQGQIGPTQPPPPPPPPKRSGLESVTKTFEKIANSPIAEFAGKAVSRYVVPGLAATQMLGEGVTAKGEFEQGDYPAAAAAGLSSLGGGLMLLPNRPAQMIGGGLSLIGPAYRSIQEGLKMPPRESLPSLMAP
jgi:hypothetical protein